MRLIETDLYYEQDGRLSKFWMGSNTVDYSGVRDVEGALKDQRIFLSDRLRKALGMVVNLPNGMSPQLTHVQDFLHPERELLAVRGVQRSPQGRVTEMVMADLGQLQLTVTEPFYTPFRGR